MYQMFKHKRHCNELKIKIKMRYEKVIHFMARIISRNYLNQYNTPRIPPKPIKRRTTFPLRKKREYQCIDTHEKITKIIYK
ncbi:hypothetical protein Y10_06200 [Neptunitalea sp. Y10]|uniref:Uncharacterized protein n=1 Tax=Neptunitalea lumnitzerae TaxID=2965509 RepID=A0ABQ5MH52_9FLAO|nr:hypothetical protein Y10_06200 [Neptunitalea sp. Y10]